MKKTYITPQTETMEMQLQQIMAGSGKLDPTSGTGSVNNTNAPEGVEGAARSFGSLWDDNEE